MSESKLDLSKLKPGDRVWFHPSAKCFVEGELTVEAVGQKWITFVSNGFRVLKTQKPSLYFNVNGGGYTTPGWIYASAADRLAESERITAWDRFRRVVNDMYRSNVSVESIRQAAELLGIDLEESGCNDT